MLLKLQKLLFKTADSISDRHWSNNSTLKGNLNDSWNLLLIANDLNR